MGSETTENTGLGAIRSLNYVIVLCDDLEAMKNFYHRIFNFRIEEEQPGKLICFRVGTLFLGLRPRGRQYDGPTIPKASASIQLSFQVPPADVDIAYETLRQNGVDMIEAPTNQDWPHRTIFFRDPENNAIEIFADIHPRDTASSPTGTHALVQP